MKRIVPIILSAVIAVSCGTTRFISPGVSAGFPESMAVAEPLISIEVIDAGDMSFHSDSLTSLAASTTGYIMDKLSWPSLVSSIVPVNEDEYDKLLSSVHFMAAANLDRKELDTFIAPKEILDFMKSNNLHQAGFIVQKGYERTSKNYSKEIGMSILEAVVMTVLSNGTVIAAETPVKCRNYFSLVVIDADAQKLLYRNTLASAAHCFDARVTEDTIRTLLRDYNNTIKKRNAKASK